MGSSLQNSRNKKFCAILNIILNAIFIPIFGYYAAGYTTLICYVSYAAAHYLCMRHVCRTYGHDVNCFNWKILLAIYGGFFVCGFGLVIVYRYPIVRYSIIILTFLCVIVFRKKLWGFIQRIRALRKET